MPDITHLSVPKGGVGDVILYPGRCRRVNTGMEHRVNIGMAYLGFL